jgi:polysaccharide export outer membrane protein
MKKNLYLSLLLFLSFITITSCVSRKQIAYFQKGPNQSDTIAVAKAYIPKIQSGDILDIKIGSLSAAASSFFNPYSAAPGVPDNASSGAVNGISAATPTGLSTGSVQTAPTGYLVDSAGMIEMPIIGAVKVAGSSTSEVRDALKPILAKYLKEPTVSVRFLNYKISVMGEVARPSVYVIPNERVTLPEALSMAGDLTIFAKRENILVIRDENGKKEFGRVNLTSRDVYSSPYYYLHANDVVYVEPGKGRVAQTDKVYQLLPVMLSALSFLVIIIEYSRR